MKGFSRATPCCRFTLRDCRESGPNSMDRVKAQISRGGGGGGGGGGRREGAGIRPARGLIAVMRRVGCVCCCCSLLAMIPPQTCEADKQPAPIWVTQPKGLDAWMKTAPAKQVVQNASSPLSSFSSSSSSMKTTGKRKLSRSCNKTREVWEERFRQLRMYRDEHGNCNVPKTYPENQKLATWVNTQRVLYAKWARTDVKARRDARSTAAKVLLLQEKPADAEAEGAGIEGGMGMGGEGAGKNGKKPRKRRVVASDHRRKLDAVREERFIRLKEAGFEFDAQQSQWEAMYSRLLRYRDFYGDSNPLLRDKHDPALGFWAAHQRKLYKQGKLTPERQVRLRSAGMALSMGRPGAEGALAIVQPRAAVSHLEYNTGGQLSFGRSRSSPAEFRNEIREQARRLRLDMMECEQRSSSPQRAIMAPSATPLLPWSGQGFSMGVGVGVADSGGQLSEGISEAQAWNNGEAVLLPWTQAHSADGVGGVNEHGPSAFEGVR